MEALMSHKVVILIEGDAPLQDRWAETLIGSLRRLANRIENSHAVKTAEFIDGNGNHVLLLSNSDVNKIDSVSKIDSLS